MKQIDLHIGCTYNSVKFGTPVTLTAEDIHEMVCRAEGASIDTYIDEIVEPIKLTEEWMPKFRFTCVHKGTWEKELSNTQEIWMIFRVMFTDKGYWIILETNTGGERKGLNIGHYKYVHTLQNIYPLTGEELTQQ